MQYTKEIQEIINKIREYQTIIIHRHVRPDPDAYGSQVGLAEIIKHSFAEKSVFVVGDEDISLSFFAKMDEVEDEVYRDALVIVCDTANQARIADERYSTGKELIKIDHHPSVDPYGDIAWVNTEASSTSEMIYELFMHAKESGFKCNDRAASLLYAGIVGDTGRFLFPSSTEKTFLYASDLVTYNFDRTALYDSMYKTKMNVARLKGYILQNFHVSESGVSSIKITMEKLEEFGLTSSETSSIVGILGDIEGIRAWVIFVEEEDLIRVRLRSKGPVINDIAAKYNGGGHPLASGATIYNWDEAEAVIKDLEEACANNQ
ncbi:bifunctional oligoribonuclease/PAP phosphatase NrnA [Aquibacillus koreensis]|uniref:Bifunctional oligoribonuclease/PAP phosphatase NrnA n=1 Tax=Aquibacillus koreensis TaxID=279446 RepID=A0A9X4AGN8_9BACI|nr:bifunctional oligoribonuclease/PAP phosphatase NrnA [Aquibacillus koreensis]MCT2537171.1 bifunctional oligoribonuclease/PAP phosphatase NrnA [Aquibacillus koreensis]MDC3419257.1 bifunctional oligoribonuclease/PAP phosphatase NrnA [Aquibacillus koreensis]